MLTSIKFETLNYSAMPINTSSTGFEEGNSRFET